jgi:hypothetical protein
MVRSFKTSPNLLRVALAACDARRTVVRLRFSATTAAARDGFVKSFDKKEKAPAAWPNA